MREFENNYIYDLIVSTDVVHSMRTSVTVPSNKYLKRRYTISSEKSSTIS